MKKLISYSMFSRTHIPKKFGVFDYDTLIEDLGVDNNTFFKVFKNRKKMSVRKKSKVLSFVNKIESVVDNKLLLRQLLSRIIFSCDYAKVTVKNDCFEAIKVDKDGSYSINIFFKDNKIFCYVTNNNNYSNIIYEKGDNEFFVKQEIKTCDKVSSGTLSIFKESTSKILKCYDKDGIQTSQSLEKTFHSYSKYNGENCFINFNTVKEYMWKDNDFVFVKRANDIEPDAKDEDIIKLNSNDTYLIGLDDHSNQSELLEPSYLYEISLEDYQLYNSGEITARKVWRKTRPKYRSRFVKE